MAGPADSGAAAPFKETPHRGIITAALLLAVLMQVLDMTIVNIALPSMQASLGAAQDTISWVLTSYIVAAAIATPLTGWFAERYGRRRIFLACVFGFVTASALCGSAFSLEQMVAYRVLQGVFGAALAPLSQSVLLDINPKERQGQAMAIWGAGIMVGPVIGPTLGSWLTENFDWRWCFYINLPVGLITFAILYLFMPDTKRGGRPFDFVGFGLLALAIGAIQMMLDRGQQLDWFSSTEIWLEAGLSLAGLWMFVVHMVTHEHPFIEMRLFRDRNFVAGLIFMFAIGTVLLSTMALLPPMLEGIFSYPVITTGMVLAPRGVGTMFSMIIVGRLVRKVDSRLLIGFGLSLTAYSLYDMTFFSPQMTWWPIVTTGIVQGVGLGFVFVPLSTIAFSTLPGQLRLEGSSLFNLIRNLGSSIGISVVTAVLVSSIQINHEELGARITPFTDIPTNGLFSTGSLATGDPQLLSVLNQLVTQQASMIGYLDAFKLMFIITLCALPLLLFLRPPKQQQGQPQEPAMAMAD
jgi:DHA2 family multidrug resistance protein